MVLGIIGMIVILQVFGLFEGQKRTTTGGDDAQNSAAIAIDGLQHDIQQAGYGVSDISVLGCHTTITGVSLSLAPVIINPATSIIPAGDAGTDTLLVFYGNSDGMGQGTVINSSTGANYQLKIPGAQDFKNGDRVIAAPIVLPPITSATACASTLAIQTASGIDTTTSILTVASGTAGTGALFNLGPKPQMLAYAIRGGNLTMCDYGLNNCSVNSAAIWVPIAVGVVSLKAQYGRDTLSPAFTQAQIVAANAANTLLNYKVDTYDQATPTTTCGWVRTAAVRLALVARNGQLEKNDVPINVSNPPTWDGNTGDPIDLTADTSWKKYRYKVLQTLVPIRNVAWMGAKAGC